MIINFVFLLCDLAIFVFTGLPLFSGKLVNLKKSGNSKTFSEMYSSINSASS